MGKSSELKKFIEYFNVLIFGSLDLKNIDLEMAIHQEWKYVINLITFTGMGPSTYVPYSRYYKTLLNIRRTWIEVAPKSNFQGLKIKKLSKTWIQVAPKRL